MARSKAPSKTVKIVVPAGKVVTRPVATIRQPAADPAEVQKKVAEIKEANLPQVPKPVAVALRYSIEMSDGKVKYAEGRHAEVLAKYLAACQEYASGAGVLYYDGPPFEELSREDFLARTAASREP